tara:strand:- start:10902 stop:11189 length:288 start_codon:yes stop_codon:yes gene_type:complete
MNIREYEGVFYNSQDFDATGRPYEDALPVKKETGEERKDRIQKAQMADDVHKDRKGCGKSCGGCNCMNDYVLLFSTNTHEGIKYDSYGFEIKDVE